MSIYCMSDIHGCFTKFKQMLELIKFSDKDTLYIIGDIVDRGPEVLETIRFVRAAKNIHLICGNHENMMVAGIIEMTKITNKGFREDGDDLRIQNWLANGGSKTMALLFNPDNPIPDLIDIFEWITKLPTYKEITVNNRDFVLVHAGVGDYEDNVPLSERDELDFIWTRNKDHRISGKIIICGHTPTAYLNADHSYNIFKEDGYINIDGGCVFVNGQLNCIRLDDMKEYVVQ